MTVLDQWGGAVWDNRLSLAGWSAGQWWIGIRIDKILTIPIPYRFLLIDSIPYRFSYRFLFWLLRKSEAAVSCAGLELLPIKWLNKYWDVLSVSEQVGVGHVTVLDQWGGAVWDNRLSLAGWSAGQWWIGIRIDKILTIPIPYRFLLIDSIPYRFSYRFLFWLLRKSEAAVSCAGLELLPIKWLNKYWDVLRVIEQVGVGHVTVLDQWGGAVWDNRLSSAGLLVGQWWRRKESEEDRVLVGVSEWGTRSVTCSYWL